MKQDFNAKVKQKPAGNSWKILLLCKKLLVKLFVLQWAEQAEDESDFWANVSRFSFWFYLEKSCSYKE